MTANAIHLLPSPRELLTWDTEDDDAAQRLCRVIEATVRRRMAPGFLVRKILFKTRVYVLRLR